MFVSPILIGVICTLSVEFVALILYVIIANLFDKYNRR